MQKSTTDKMNSNINSSVNSSVGSRVASFAKSKLTAMFWKWLWRFGFMALGGAWDLPTSPTRGCSWCLSPCP